MSSRQSLAAVSETARQVVAERSLARLPQGWVSDDLIAGTALSIVAAVAATLIMALVYFSSF